MQYPKPITKLIESFSKLPGVGHKTAERLAFYVISDMNDDEATKFARALIDAKRALFECETCAFVTDSNPCSICADGGRDVTMIAVVESSKDVLSLEKMRSFHGRYHVLGGVLSPLDGIGPEDIGIAPLIERLKNEEVTEVILALGATLEGDATSQYLARLLKGTGVRITRIARGLEMGRSIDYADEVTLIRALEGRVEL
ncbi:MAG: recombination mediator RecR [Defluviitaleaceae bacterium]|nr:recombination mediator RecR [Defluviitaleaceae bacterium]